ncbi:streptogrisin C [Prauserella shujinwangii]|uniref:Streptogrisin C n=1 Tax=Prauserella shujinwangii TaxID=1453103 RepID=A0A2T0LKL4_9PSEU|nr:S1 family peptidase [Prauserella shujinwangii]PRX43450.1 streptogrisin C [Prauserella shujinwangii]
MPPRPLHAVRTAVLAAALAVAGTLPVTLANASAADSRTEDGGAPVDVSAELLTALDRDLGLDAREARAHFAAQDRAGRTEELLRETLGSSFAGGWLPRGGHKLVVGVTDPADAAPVRAAGAEPRVVEHSEAELSRAVATLDSHRAKAPRAVVGWYHDLPANAVVLQTKPGGEAAAERFLADAGVDTTMVRVRRTHESPRPLYDVRGGDAYYIGSGSRCSIGFSVNGGFVTAGHCGNTGQSTSGHNRVAQGTFRGSSFPGNDYAWVATNSNWTPRPVVNNYAGGTVTVAGSQEAPVGSAVCRSGSTTGWHCGTIQARNASVTYPQGTVSGLIRTSVCAEPGDSGGSLLAGNQAQGVTSGGSGNCRSGGTTYFQPVNEILQAYGLSLLTSGGGGGNPPGDACEGAESTYRGSLSSGNVAYQPDGSYYQATASGTHSGCLAGPSGTDFDLYLQKWNGSAWATVASGTTPSNNEQVSYSGTAGYYRFVVHAYSGSGSYTLGVTTP